MKVGLVILIQLQGIRVVKNNTILMDNLVKLAFKDKDLVYKAIEKSKAKYKEDPVKALAKYLVTNKPGH